jgi:hypothetical protein
LLNYENLNKILNGKITFKLTESQMQHIMKMSEKENKKFYSKRKHKIETIFGDWK